jgi:hypothetical protein
MLFSHFLDFWCKEFKKEMKGNKLRSPLNLISKELHVYLHGDGTKLFFGKMGQFMTRN